MRVGGALHYATSRCQLRLTSREGNGRRDGSSSRGAPIRSCRSSFPSQLSWSNALRCSILENRESSLFSALGSYVGQFSRARMQAGGKNSPQLGWSGASALSPIFSLSRSLSLPRTHSCQSAHGIIEGLHTNSVVV